MNEFDFTNMTDKERQQAREFIRNSKQFGAFMKELSADVPSGIETELLSRYVSHSFADSSESISDEDIQYVEAMLQHSGEWRAVYRKMVDEVTGTPHSTGGSTAMNDTPAVYRINDTSRKAHPLRSGFAWAASLAAAIAIVYVSGMILGKPALSEFELAYDEKVRGVHETSNADIQRNARTALQNGRYEEAISFADILTESRDSSEWLEGQHILAKANMNLAESSIAGSFRSYNTERLEYTVASTTKIIEHLKVRQDDMYERQLERALYMQTVSYLLLGREEEAAESFQKFQQVANELQGNLSILKPYFE